MDRFSQLNCRSLPYDTNLDGKFFFPVNVPIEPTFVGPLVDVSVKPTCSQYFVNPARSFDILLCKQDYVVSLAECPTINQLVLRMLKLIMHYKVNQVKRFEEE